MYETRLIKLRRELSEAGVESLLVSSPLNINYLSGFTGDSGWLLVTQGSQYLITDFRFMIQAKEEAPGSTVVIHQGNMLETLNDLVQRQNLRELGFEAQHCSYESYKRMESALSGITLTGQKAIVEELRKIKDSGEIELVRQAVAVSDGAFEHVLSYIRPGVSEFEIAARLEYFMRRQGAQKPSFDTIIGSGYRGALPHGTASQRKVETGDLIVLDFGADKDSYCSDITRTVAVGKASQEQRKIYAIVLEAQLAALEAVKPGKQCCEIDRVAREIIAGHGYGDYFGHGLGHGVGMEVHESPALNARNQAELVPGMIITVEPGIYIDGWGGVRIEDMVLVTAQGCEILTESKKEFLEL